MNYSSLNTSTYPRQNMDKTIGRSNGGKVLLSKFIHCRFANDALFKVLIT